jgi:hypothetical protein
MGRFRRYTLSGAAVALVLATGVAAQSTLSPIKQLLAGSGLVGGGPGPTVTIGIGPGLVTGSHVQDGTLQVADLAPAAQTALKGAQGPVGPAGSQGPQGVPGPQGPAGAEPDLLSRSLSVNQSIPTDQETSLSGLTTNVTLAEERIVHAFVQVTVSDVTTRLLRISLVVDGQIVASARGEAIDDRSTPPFFHTLSTQRSIKLIPGAHTIEARVFGPFFDRTTPFTVLGSADRSQTFMDVELR